MTFALTRETKNKYKMNKNESYQQINPSYLIDFFFKFEPAYFIEKTLLDDYWEITTKSLTRDYKKSKES